MAAYKFTLGAKMRSDLGKGASRRLRQGQKLLPGILYGGAKAATPIILEQDKLAHALENEAFYSHILTLNLDGTEEKVILRDLHRHPFKKLLLHVDFQRVASTDVINMRVPLHFINREICPGTKNGGIINHLTMEIEVKCKAKDLPEFIQVDLANLQLNDSIHLSGLVLPAGVEIVELSHGKEHDITVVSVHLPRTSKADEEATIGSTTAVPSAADEKKAKEAAKKDSAKKDTKKAPKKDSK
jgi:large subunit ribosomal protein L25